MDSFVKMRVINLSSHHLIGVTLFNSATFYGPLNENGFGANLRLLKTAIEGLDRSKIQLMVKICMDTRYMKIV